MDLPDDARTQIIAWRAAHFASEDGRPVAAANLHLTLAFLGQYVSVPVADGGEGTVEAMIAATQGVERAAWVTGPLGEKVKAC
ncbi:glycerate kinase, partial [Salmonella enterica subsp. enterica serovar Montevideo]|nr:glycerate kinase [Salmonella enterica subsp. enterica serovar Montevideo]